MGGGVNFTFTHCILFIFWVLFENVFQACFAWRTRIHVYFKIALNLNIISGWTITNFAKYKGHRLYRIYQVTFWFNRGSQFKGIYKNYCIVKTVKWDVQNWSLDQKICMTYLETSNWKSFRSQRNYIKMQNFL